MKNRLSDSLVEKKEEGNIIIQKASDSCTIRQCSESEGITDCGHTYAPRTGTKYCPFCGRKYIRK